MKKLKAIHTNLKTVFLKKHGSKIDISNPAVKEYLHLKSKDRLCFAPFTNLYFGIDGSIASCYAQSYIVDYGKYPETSITDAWNSNTAKRTRSLVEDRYLPPACNLCYTQVLERNFDVSYAGVYDQHKPDADFPVSMEFYLDNTCNLECIMCSAENSSLIAKKNGISKQKSPYTQLFLDELNSFIPNLKHTYFFGGEPFLISIYYDIWEQIINLNRNCIIDITTNGTVVNEKVKSILGKANFNINISIDSLQKERFESIRNNADFETVMKNLDYFYEYCGTKNTQFFISFCPLQQNWEEIPDILEFANKLDAGLVYNRVWNPANSALWTLNPQKIEEIITYLEKFKFTPTTNIQRFNTNGYYALINQLNCWHTSALDFYAMYSGEISSEQLIGLLTDLMKTVYRQNKNSMLSEIKNHNQLSKQINQIVTIVKDSNLNEHERSVFYRNLIMQKSFFANALFFANSTKNIAKIVHLASK